MGYDRFTNRGLDHYHCTVESQKTTVTLQDKENAPLLQWLNSGREDSAHKRVKRAKDQTSISRMPPARLSLVNGLESSVVVGHRVTQDSLEYLVKGATRPWYFRNTDTKRKRGLLSCDSLHDRTEGFLDAKHQPKCTSYIQGTQS